MSAATVTYQELPPMATWATDGHGVVENGNGTLMHFADGLQYPEHHSGVAWNSFCVEGNAGKCAPMQTTAHHVTNGLDSDWMGRPVVQQSNVSAPPPAYGVYAREVANGPNPYDCPQSMDTRCGKKRFAHMRVNSNGLISGGGTNVGAGVGGSQMAPEELCLVCGDKASGYHYNALTCEGCKGFFRRSITRKAMYYCKYGGHCDIDMYMRRKCQACRLRKCLDIGMRPELVIPEEQCRLKRESKNKMRTVNGGNNNACGASNTPASSDERKSNSPQQVTSTESLSPNPTVVGLTPEQRELVHRLVLYQEQYEMPSDEELAKLTTFRNDQIDPQQQQHNHMQFQHLAELTILNVQLIVEFTKRLPGFLTLNNEDQLTLLKACSTEILMLKTARRYDQKTDAVVLGNRNTSWSYSRDAYKQAGMGSATDAIFEFSKSMAKLRVDAAEFALLTAISIFSERPGLTEPRKVDDIQEVYTSTLQAYIDVHRPKNRTVFARLLMKLTDLRTLGCEQADVLYALKLDSTGNKSDFDSTQDSNLDSREAALSLQPCGDVQKMSKLNPVAAGRKISKQQQPQHRPVDQASQHEEQASQATAANYRMPNVRIKVEPLTYGGQASASAHFSNPNANESSTVFECRPQMFPQQGDYEDANNNSQQPAVSSTFLEPLSKWP